MHFSKRKYKNKILKINSVRIGSSKHERPLMNDSNITTKLTEPSNPTIRYDTNEFQIDSSNFLTIQIFKMITTLNFQDFSINSKTNESSESSSNLNALTLFDADDKLLFDLDDYESTNLKTQTLGMR